MDTSKIIRGIVNARGYTVTKAITQWDYGYVFVPEFEDMPATYRLDFSNDEHHGTALPVYCGSEGGEVPESLIDTGKDIYVWFYYIGDGFGKTEYEWRIPNHCKPKTEQDEPTPSQQSSIDQAISVVNEAVEQAQDAQQAIEDMSVSATTLSEGSSATVTKSEQDGVVHLEFGIPRGADGSGGGTGDYNDLSNKPSINGNVLSGNKTAAQLGLATPSDIPIVPVQSVNGKTGAVVLGASDVGALPAGTAIPSKTSDLTNDSGFVNAAGAASAAPVQSVNLQTGAVSLTIPTTAADVGAMDSSDYTTETWTFTLFDNTTVTKKVVVEA